MLDDDDEINKGVTLGVNQEKGIINEECYVDDFWMKKAYVPLTRYYLVS